MFDNPILVFSLDEAISRAGPCAALEFARLVTGPLLLGQLSRSGYSVVAPEN